MPIRLIKKKPSRVFFDAEVKALRKDTEQYIALNHKRSKILLSVKVPKWIDGDHGEAELLTKLYTDVLKLADENKCENILLPLEFRKGTFPKERIYSIVINAINNYLDNSDLTVYLLISHPKRFVSGCFSKDKLLEYLANVYEPAMEYFRSNRRKNKWWKPFDITDIQAGPLCTVEKDEKGQPTIRQILTQEHKGYIQIPESVIKRLNELLKEAKKETFTEMLVRLISEKGLKPSQCYKRANMDKRLFSKIKRNKNYHPQKETAIALALALELDIDQTNLFLMKAGYALSHIDMRDVIVEFFIKEKQYNIMEIDGILFEKGLALLSNYE